MSNIVLLFDVIRLQALADESQFSLSWPWLFGRSANVLVARRFHASGNRASIVHAKIVSYFSHMVMDDGAGVVGACVLPAELNDSGIYTITNCSLSLLQATFAV